MTAKKILLVSANQLKIPYPVYPIGISYIKSFLADKLPEFEIRTFDFMDRNYSDFNDFLNLHNPDYICISFRNIDDVNLYKQESFINHYKNIIELIRNTSNSKIIIGGAGFSIFPELLFDLLNPDFAIYGEGEENLFHLITALEKNSDFSKINSLLYRKSGSVIFNKENQSLNKLSLQFEPELLNYYWQYSGMLNIQTKRGCPYNCIYCTYPIIEGRKVRTLDIDSIIETLSNLAEKQKVDYVFFTDSIFNIHNDYNRELAERMISKNLNIKWGAYFNFCDLDENILKLFQKAGLKHIEFGTESLCDATLKNYKKPFNVAEIIEISNICVKLGIDYAHFLILGGYGETEETINETFENSKRINHSIFFPFVGMRIYPGTELYKIAIEENKVDKKNDLLLPVYYISDKVDISLLKEKAKKTGKKWIFPDDDLSKIVNKMRLKNKKGPLWEYLVQ